MMLEGRVALVTGASRGIGAAVARALAEAGVRLGLASRSGDDLGLDAVAQPCDVRDPEQVESLVDATVARFGRLDILVANAGVGAYGPFLELEAEHLDEMIDVNLKGTVYSVRAALPHLLASDGADFSLLLAMQSLGVVAGVESIGITFHYLTTTPDKFVKTLRSRTEKF